MYRKIQDNLKLIKDVIINEDTRQAGYNMGDLLNIPYLSNQWDENCHKGLSHHTYNELFRMNLLGNFYKKSILYYYTNSRKDNNEVVPNIKLINESVNTFKNNNYMKYQNILTQVKNPTTLCIHLRVGEGFGALDSVLIESIKYFSKIFKYLIILMGVHLDEAEATAKDKIKSVTDALNIILNLSNNIFYYHGNADIHLMLMSEASNLLVHNGGYSCLGSIVSTGNLFITDLFYFKDSDNWKTIVAKDYTLINNSVDSVINITSKLYQNNIDQYITAAWYGNPDNDQELINVTEIIKNKVINGELTINVNNQLFGDPCLNILKILKIEYLIDDEKYIDIEKENNILLIRHFILSKETFETQSRLINEEVKNLSDNDHQGKITLISAWYGNPNNDNNGIDVTQKVNDLLKDGHIKFQITTDLFGDPCPDIEKVLKLEYHQNGETIKEKNYENNFIYFKY